MCVGPARRDAENVLIATLRPVAITGAAWICAPALNAALSDPAAAIETPEITGFETPADSPTWGFEAYDFSAENELPTVKSFIDRTSALALGAAVRALRGAGLERSGRPAGGEIGCSYATMLGCLEAMGIFWNKVKTSNPKFAQPLPFTQGYANSPAALLCIEQALRGPAAVFSGERNCGWQALQFAFDQLQLGAGEALLVAASESFTPAAYNHFLARGELAAAAPWSGGTVLGEGGVALVLETAERAAGRGAKALAVLESVDACAASDGVRAGALTVRSALEPHGAGDWVPMRAAGDLLAAGALLDVALAAQVLSGGVALPACANGIRPAHADVRRDGGAARLRMA